MSNRKVADLLNSHAEALQAGASQGDALLTADPDQRGLLAGLFALAGRVYGALAPVEPKPDFVADLKRQLIASAERAADSRARARQRRTVAVAAGAGGLVYAVGLAVLAVRAGLSTAGLVAALLTRRRRDQPAQAASADA